MQQLVVHGKTYDVFVAACGEAIGIGDPIARKLISEFPRIDESDQYEPVPAEIEFARFVIEKITDIRKAA